MVKSGRQAVGGGGRARLRKPAGCSMPARGLSVGELLERLGEWRRNTAVAESMN